MTKIFKLLFVSALFFFLGHQSLQAQEQAEDVTKKFFDTFEKTGSDAAIDFVFSTNKWLAGDKTTVDGIKSQFSKGIAIIGQYYGYELIDKKSAGENFVVLTYVLRYDRQPIKFIFILYRPNQKWQIQNLKLDDRLDDDM